MANFYQPWPTISNQGQPWPTRVNRGQHNCLQPWLTLTVTNYGKMTDQLIHLLINQLILIDQSINTFM